MDDRIIKLMNDMQKHNYGNPSSIHREGQSARAIIEKSRRQLSNILNCKANEIIFTSSGTEANNMVLKGVLENDDHLITSSYEHPAILKVLPYLKNKGVEFSIVKPNQHGIIEVEKIKKELKRNTKLISIMHVNNELGTINPIKEIAKLASKQSILFHSDAVQALGKIPMDVKDIPVDFLSMSAHKLYGPKGIGALYIREGTPIKPLIHGGGQESNLRGSTENIAGIGGFGMASEISSIDLEENSKHILQLEKYFMNQLDDKKISYKINGNKRVPGVFNITFPDMDGKSLVMQLDLMGIGISFGAACASGTLKTSNMLIDMGLTNEEALSTVRISFGKIHGHDDITTVTNALENILNKHKQNMVENV